MQVIDKKESGAWAMYHADCVDVMSAMQDNCIDYSIFSPPFVSLYTFSDSDRDMSNVKDKDEFFAHFRFCIEQLFRIVKPGRCVSVHCMNIQTSKAHHGYIGIYDFRGDIIRAFEKAGFIFHSEVCIWKDPVTAMQRTKALGLLHKQLCKDSCMSRQGIPDYLVTFRKPGENAAPVAGALTHYVGDEEGVNGDDSIGIWQRYASPVWMDIRQSDTLQFRDAKDPNDERHICPLQLDVIHRGVQLWTNPGDIVLSPFAGIGSEGYESILCGRRFIGAELKESYFRLACSNLAAAEIKSKEGKLL